VVSERKKQTVMSARADILKAIRERRPASPPLPQLPKLREKGTDIQSRFCESLLLAGAEWVPESAILDWGSYLEEHYPDCQEIVTALPELAGPNIQYLPATMDTRSLQNVDVAIIKGDWGVAENGAIWVPQEQLPARVLPFITQHLILLLSTDKIVETMHDAYHYIRPGSTSFGVFIAGPSKTADIEQSLVKGAQGARSALVVLQRGAS
jgi:L-lactate dehydrogenase complex protein LldG